MTLSTSPKIYTYADLQQIRKNGYAILDSQNLHIKMHMATRYSDNHEYFPFIFLLWSAYMKK